MIDLFWIFILNSLKLVTFQRNIEPVYRKASGSINIILYCGEKLKKSLKIPKGVIRIRISKKNWQHNGQKKKYKRTNNDLQNIHIKLKIE